MAKINTFEIHMINQNDIICENLQCTNPRTALETFKTMFRKLLTEERFKDMKCYINGRLEHNFEFILEDIIGE